MRRLGAAAVVAGALLGAPAGAQAADPPPGAAMSTNLQYVTRVAGANGIVEGKFDRVKGKDVLVVTGRFGFKTYDVSDPENPRLMDEYLPAGASPTSATGRTRTWSSTRAASSSSGRSTRGTTTATRGDRLSGSGRRPCATRTARAASTSSRTRTRRELQQVGDFVSLPAGHTASCIQDCRYIWTGGPARRDDQGWLGPILPGTPANGNRLIGDGRPIWVTDLTNPSKPEVSDEPIDVWRNDQYTDYSHDVDEDDAGHRVGQRPRRHPRLRDRGPASRPVPEPLARGDAVRPDPRRRRRRRRHARSRRCSCTTPAGPPTAPSGRRASRRATCSSAPRRTSRRRAGRAARSCSPTPPTRSAGSRPRSRRWPTRTG